jgi:hypothetical protein
MLLASAQDHLGRGGRARAHDIAQRRQRVVQHRQQQRVGLDLLQIVRVGSVVANPRAVAMKARAVAIAPGMRRRQRLVHWRVDQPADLGKLVGQNLMLEAQLRGIGDMLPGHVIGARQRRLDPVGRGVDHLDDIAARIGVVALAQPHLHTLARQPAAGEHHALLPAPNSLAALSDTI